MPSVAISDEKSRSHDEAAYAGSERHARQNRCDNREERTEAHMDDQREDPGREAHRRRKREINLSNRDDEDQRRHQAKRDRQGHEHRVVDRPVQEHGRARRHEDRDHDDEDGKRAERGAIAVGEAPQRAIWRARDRSGARFHRFEGGGHLAASGVCPAEARISIPCGCASRSI